MRIFAAEELAIQSGKAITLGKTGRQMRKTTNQTQENSEVTALPFSRLSTFGCGFRT